MVAGGGGGGWWWLKATLVFIFGPNLKTKTLFRPRPKLNKIYTISLKMTIYYKKFVCQRVSQGWNFKGDLLDDSRTVGVIGRPRKHFKYSPLAVYQLPMLTV